MKKIIAIAAICIGLLGAFAFTSYQVSPVWPNGTSTALTIGQGTTAVTISNNMNHVSSITTLTANATLSVTANSKLRAGAHMLLVVKTQTTSTMAFTGSAIAAPTFTGVAGKTFSQLFIYNGTKFYPAGAVLQVD